MTDTQGGNAIVMLISCVISKNNLQNNICSVFCSMSLLSLISLLLLSSEVGPGSHHAFLASHFEV